MVIKYELLDFRCQIVRFLLVNDLIADHDSDLSIFHIYIYILNNQKKEKNKLHLKMSTLFLSLSCHWTALKVYCVREGGDGLCCRTIVPYFSRM